MSSFDSMGSFESTASPIETDDQEPPSSLSSAYRSQFVASGVAFPFKRQSISSDSHNLSYFSPWLISLVYPLGRWVVLPSYFGSISISGQEHLPRSGSVILAPTHRSRWDAILVAYAAGYHVTGRHLRYMVSKDEVVGLQGWLIRRLGGFPVDTHRPAIATLRHGVDLLQWQEPLVIFPEGNIFRESGVQSLKPGLARIAMQAQISQPRLNVQVVPVCLTYSNPAVPSGCRVSIDIGHPLAVANYCQVASKKNAHKLTTDLFEAMNRLSQK